jgi:hypothetical protein
MIYDLSPADDTGRELEVKDPDHGDLIRYLDKLQAKLRAPGKREISDAKAFAAEVDKIRRMWGTRNEKATPVSTNY